eukprot:TRINITY_DN5443_c0_g1_i3.p1 TRINITY_DN5443_c0_g1~~TRINITY_DN5443_c0_g1_i3.p1  ORF type:complete len:507 (-),score=88.03 TRINITY_DN5443_c0_g1_i3:167-1687(-)
MSSNPPQLLALFTFSDEEYERYLKHESWTLEETRTLLDSAFPLKFDWHKIGERLNISPKECKQRYLTIKQILDEVRASTPGESSSSSGSNKCASSTRATLKEIFAQRAQSKHNSEEGKRKRESYSPGNGKKRRVRRTAAEIERNWRCDINSCNKAYGTEGALKMHMKLKHPGFKQSKPKTLQAPGSSKTINGFDQSPQVIPFGVPQYVSIQQPRFHSDQDPRSSSRSSSPGASSDSSHFSGFLGQRRDSFDNSYPETSSFQIGAFSGPLESPNPTGRRTSYDTNMDSDFLSSNESPSDSDASSEDAAFLPVLMLKIGTWHKTSLFCGDLVARFSFKDKQFEWEIFSMGSLLKIEIEFDDVTGLGLEVFSDGTAMLIVEIRKPPIFSNGCLIEPHSSNAWAQVPDFTNGQASSCCQHVLHFSKLALNLPLERLLSEVPRLKELAKRGLASNAPLHFAELVPSSIAPSGIDQFPPSSLSSVFPGARPVRPPYNSSPKSTDDEDCYGRW